MTDAEACGEMEPLADTAAERVAKDGVAVLLVDVDSETAFVIVYVPESVSEGVGV